MNGWHRWLLPAVLAAGQLALWPVGPLVGGERPAPGGVVMAVAATTVVAVALAWRVRAPYHCCTAVAVVLWAGTAGTPQDALAVIGVAELVALFSVAAHRPLDRALAAAGLFGVGSVVATLLSYGATGDAVGAVGLTTVSYLLTVGLGHSRQRWRLGRRQAAAALATAQLAQQQAAARERHRLACELHDVSAHHLTAVVVTVTAARRLSASRPDLAGQALRFAVDAAHQTTATLRQLVGVLRHDPTGYVGEPGTLNSRLAGLVAGFRELGQPVELAVDAHVTDRDADLVFACVREALTNSVRYAPGGPVRVDIGSRTGRLLVTVVNQLGTRPAEDDVIGSGSGLAGVRERARPLGGDLTAGPTDDGGWQVRLDLPTADPATGRRARAAGPDLTDLALTMLAIALPVGVVALDWPLLQRDGPGPVLVLLALLVAHAAALPWRRRAPWPVLAATTGSTLAWPLAIGAGLLPSGDVVTALLAGCLAEAVAIWTVATRTTARVSWLAVPTSALVIGLVVAIGLVNDVDPGADVGFGADGQPVPTAVTVVTAGIATIVFAVLLGVGFAVVWAAGLVMRRRRGRVLRGERTAILTANVAADSVAYAARRRIAAQLDERVLPRAAEVAAVAGRPPAADPVAQLDEVAAVARSALAAMRDLLVGLRSTATGDDGTPVADADDRTPQPTTVDLTALAAAYRAAGRPVTTYLPDGPDTLPVALDVCAYRLAEAALAAGDAGPAQVRVALGPEPCLYLEVRGVAAAVRDPTVAALRARAEALAGVCRVAPGGTLQVWLPYQRPPAHQEVTASVSG